MQIMGQPCNNKKSAEKDASTEALQWLMGGTQTGHEYMNLMLILLKKSKRDHHTTMAQSPIEGFVRNVDPNKWGVTVLFFCHGYIVPFPGKMK